MRIQQNTSPKDECLGHRFGAGVKTESKRKIQEAYHEHFFTNVVKNGVADKMQIRYICFFTVQSTLVIWKSKGPFETHRDIRTSTYQICRIEENTNGTTKFHK